MGARELLVDLAAEGLTVAANGDRLVVRPASKLTDAMRAALTLAKPELLALLLDGGSSAQYAQAREPASRIRTDADIAAFLKRRARLLRWGWTEADAERLAERLVQRDRDIDDRVSCADCRHYSGRTCANHRAAGVGDRNVGRSFAEVLQRCPGFGDRGGINA